MTKMTFGVLLILAMVVPASATVITQAYLNSLNTTLIDTNFSDYAFVTGITPVNSALTVNFNPGVMLFNGYGPGGNDRQYPATGPGTFQQITTALTITFSSPVVDFGFVASPDHPFEDVKTFTVDYFSGPNGTGTLVDQTINGLTDYGFFGAEDNAIRSVTIQVGNGDDSFALSDMRYALAPEPTTSLLIGAGLLGLGLVSRRRWAR